jgi:hypothetical protein
LSYGCEGDNVPSICLPLQRRCLRRYHYHHRVQRLCPALPPTRSLKHLHQRHHPILLHHYPLCRYGRFCSCPFHVSSKSVYGRRPLGNFSTVLVTE